jgi:hypothetical protein
MNGTIADQLFMAKEEIELGEVVEHNKNFDNYIFKHGIIPLGAIRLRQQRRPVVPCEGTIELVTLLREDPDQQIKCLAWEGGDQQ